VSKTDTRQSIVCRVLAGQHSAKYILKILKQSLSSACQGALSKDIFVECLSGGSRQRHLCRVPDRGHSAKYCFKLKKSLPSAKSRALGKECYINRPCDSLLLLSFSHSHRTLSVSPPSDAASVAVPCHLRRHRPAPS
jgi:hypothetical protein